MAMPMSEPVFSVPRAQGAVEYLVLLGAVLVVAIIVITLLGLWPQGAGDMKNNEQSSFWISAQPFGIKDAQQSAQSLVSLSMVNHAPRPLTLVSVNLTYSDGYSYVNNTRTDFGAGENKLVAITGSAHMFDCTTHSGRSLSYNVTITYDDDPLTGKVQAPQQQLGVRCN